MQYSIWFMENNSQMVLDSATRMVHDGQGHNLYRYENGILRALSGHGSMRVQADGRILDSTGNRIGFITDYPRLTEELRPAESVSAPKTAAPKVAAPKAAAKQSSATSSAAPSSRSTPARGAAGAAKDSVPPKKKGRGWLAVLAILGVILLLSGNRGTSPSKVPLDASRDAAALRLRKGIVNHEDLITVRYRSETKPENKFKEAKDLYYAATDHTGNPDEGDQLVLGACFDDNVGLPYTVEENGRGYIISIDYRMTYYTTLEQEKQLRSRIRSIVSELAPAGKSEYEKTRAIYNWICSHVTYDFARLNDDSYMMKYTAYNGVMEGTCVCAGYAQLFYRMALSAGLEARIMTDFNHAWNLVRIGGKYYHCDATWDAGLPESRYGNFLKGNWDFQNHLSREGFPSTLICDQLRDMMQRVPMSLENYGE